MVRTHPDPPFIGGVAQLGERLLCKQEVIGSIPFTSTSLRAKRDGCHAETQRVKAGLFGATAGQAGTGQKSNQDWIGRSKLFVGQQRPAFAIFDIVKSGVTEEASADACCLTCRQKSASGMPKKYRLSCLSQARRTVVLRKECLHVRLVFLAGLRPASDEFCDQASKKGIWWMPWYREAMKDVARCDKPGGDASDR